jgi:hypothetical protein
MYSKEDIINVQKNPYYIYLSLYKLKLTPFEEQLNELYKNINYILYCNVEKFPELYDYYVLSKI